jgi:hypothetical protein
MLHHDRHEAFTILSVPDAVSANGFFEFFPREFLLTLAHGNIEAVFEVNYVKEFFWLLFHGAYS